MRSALLGYTGFVGGNLLREHTFAGLYNSANVEALAGERFDLVVCAGAPAAKWKAIQDPVADRACLARLTAALGRVSAKYVVLVSTADVFGEPEGVDEGATPSGATPYGRHRLELEQFVAGRFDALVVRLPALFGPGLKKNAVYDLLHHNQVEKIDGRAVYQFYDVRRLWRDVAVARAAGLSLVHLATEPVSMGEVARSAFGLEWANELPGRPPCYDLRTRHAGLYGGAGGYLATRAQVLAALAEFVATERGIRRCA
jgi:nucleoside-diphosphate-sugar epimerase